MDDREADWFAAYGITRLFVARALGARSRRIADQDAAIQPASDELDASDTPEAAAGRRFLAIEYAAWTSTHHAPERADWEAAIVTVDADTDADVRRKARGGMVIRAAQGGWYRRRAKGLVLG